MPPVAPAPVDHFFRATNAHDADGLVATFADDGVIYNADEGTYRGREGVAIWNDKEFIGANCTVDILDVIITGKEEVIVTGDTKGDFPGNQIVLFYLFSVAGDRISALTIHH